MQRRLKTRQRGETLLEVIIAVAILSMVMVSVFALLIRGASTNVNVTNRVVAINVAREGVEAVRNIRDTNWLKYSGDRRGKWLCFDSPTADACVGGAAITLGQGTYTIEFDETNKRYYLYNQNFDVDVTERDTLPNEAFRLYMNGGRFSHVAAGGEVTQYYRQIHLSPESELIDAGCGAGDDCARNERMLVSVRVQWMEDSAVRHLDMETYLYDFFGRDEY